jgi:hypothetical protein
MVGLNNSMTKLFKPTYLCIKTHTVTGLKYFCKTTKNDYHSYPGSGIYWRRHLKEHGWSFTTELLGFYINKEECNAEATKFSIDNDIVKAVRSDGKKIWANAIIENGLDGGATWYGLRPQEMIDRIAAKNRGRKRSLEVREKCRQNSLLGTKRKSGEWNQSEESKQKIREKRALQVITKESREKAAEKLRGKKRPDVSIRLKGRKHTAEARENMRVAQQNKGPLSEDTKQKIREKRKLQVFTDETKKKLSGKVIVVDKQGNMLKITKEQYYAQVGEKDAWEWIFHRNKEAMKRKLK